MTRPLLLGMLTVLGLASMGIGGFCAICAFIFGGPRKHALLAILAIVIGIFLFAWGTN